MEQANSAPQLVPHHFQPGQSGNPGGRPKGLSRLIREQTQDGLECVQLYLETMRDKKLALEMRLGAANWLIVNSFGKPKESIDHTVTDQTEERRTLEVVYVNRPAIPAVTPRQPALGSGPGADGSATV